MSRLAPDAARILAATSDLLEEVFRTVAQIRTAALQGFGDVPAEERRASVAFPGLDRSIGALLRAHGQLATGLGVIVAPRTGRPRPLQQYWWQLDQESGRVLALAPDLNPSSVGFYDYTAASWFDVPRRTGHRYVAGPYVDVHGSGQYLLTLTAPVVADGTFLGVAGADVPFARFENRLLAALGAMEHRFVLVNEEGRVAVSTEPGRLVGSLFRGTPAAGPDLAAAMKVPWSLHLLGRTPEG